MNALLELIPISDLRHQPSAVLNKLPHGPVVLTQRGRAAAVLVSPEQWNRLVEDLEDALDAIAALKARVSLASGEDELIDWETVESHQDAVQA